MLMILVMVFTFIASQPCESRIMFVLPTLDQDTWTRYNNEVSALLGPLHLEVSTGEISPAQAAELFSSRLGEFLSSKQEFVKDQKENSSYTKHESTALKKARAAKNALRKKAFGKNSTKEDMQQFRQAVKTHNFLKKLDETKHKQKTSRHHESLYRKNFYKFAKNCTNGTLDQTPQGPTFSETEANTYYPTKYSQPNPVDLAALTWFPYLPIPASNPFNLEPIRPKHIKAILHSKKPTSAPGPDGIMYGILRKLPATHHVLATVFTKMLMEGDPPESWSKSTVTLIHKAGDTSDPQNFRMISLTSCVGKVFHQTMSDRISEYLLSNNYIDSSTQKAFLKGINGCIEHTFVMNELLANARNKKKTIHVTFFDLADAFGSVEHNLIFHTLQRNGLSKTVFSYVENLYSRLQGQVKGPSWTLQFQKGSFRVIHCLQPFF